MSFIRVISIAYLLFVVGSACQAADNPGAARLAGFQNTARLSLFGENEGKVILVGGALAGAVLGLFGYLYGREWYLNRRLRSYKVGGATDGVLPRPGPDETGRKPLVHSDAVALESATDLSGMCDPSNRKAVGQKQRVWKPSEAAPPTGLAASASFGRGRLNVEAEGDSVEAYIDGEFVGMTPAKLNLVEGTHFVELRTADGCRRYRREIRIMDGAETNLEPVWDDLENVFR